MAFLSCAGGPVIAAVRGIDPSGQVVLFDTNDRDEVIALGVSAMVIRDQTHLLVVLVVGCFSGVFNGFVLLLSADF